MKNLNFDVVVKIGSMAMIREDTNEIDYNRISSLARALRPGYILVSSGATEIGRIDYLHRNGSELRGDLEEIKTDYSAQGQALLMSLYRQFADPRYSLRQVLVEHMHFNDREKADHLRKFFYRAANQNAIPIVNYNDPLSNEETRRMEIAALREERAGIVECVDNDETAAVVASLVGARRLVILTSTNGIYRDLHDPSTLIPEISGESVQEMEAKIDEAMSFCQGASRVGANGAKAKLLYAKQAIENGTEVRIANAKYPLDAILAGDAPSTRLFLRK